MNISEINKTQNRKEKGATAITSAESFINRHELQNHFKMDFLMSGDQFQLYNYKTHLISFSESKNRV